MNKFRRLHLTSALIAVVFLLSAGIAGLVLVRTGIVKADSANHHYEYFTPDGSLFVYDIDNNFSLVKQVSLPTTNVRGVSANVKTDTLYVSFGGDGGGHGTGSLLAYSLLNDTILWVKNYPFGIDDMDITPDGTHIYMPDGEAAYDGTWHELDASNGNVLATITIGSGLATHNTLVNASGTHVYLGSLNYNYLVELDTATNQVIQRIGPLTPGGVRPFTINRAETLAFTTTTGFIGFDVSSIITGKKLYTAAPSCCVAPAGSNAPSHGITLSPDEKTVYIVDQPFNMVHVYDVSGLPATAPTHLADIPLQTGFSGNEVPCGYDCTHEGWILYTVDGRYILVGDSGDVIDTATRKTVMHLQELQNTRKYLEVDWTNGVPTYASSRLSVILGTPYPTPTGTPTATATTPGITPTATTPGVTPTPGSVLAQDTFQRANQTYWGTASGGQTWGGDANTSNMFSIANNTGKIVGNGNPYNAILGSPTTDAEVLFTGSLSNYSGGNLGAVLRWTDTNNWYKSYISGTQLVIQSRVNGVSTTLASVNFNATAGTSYSLRFRAVGNNLYAKVWPSNSSEPASWMATATNSSLTSGSPGLRSQVPNGATALFTSYVATTPGTVVTPTPTPTMTPTATVTPTPTMMVTVTPTTTVTPTPTPTAGAVVAQDTFTRANQTYWGTASDGQTWAGDANNNSAFSIAANKGVIAPGTTPYNAVLGPSESNADVFATGSLSSFNSSNFGTVVRWTDANNWYKAYINGTQLVIQKKVNGTATTLTTANFTASANTSYNIRFDAVGSTLSAKVWAAGSAEPANWMATTTDTSFTSGFCGLRIQLQTAISASVTSFIAKALQ